MEKFFNIIHYCLYKTHYKMHLLANKLNPFILLGRIPASKRKFQEQGTTLTEVVNKIWGDERYGFSIMISGGGLVASVSFLIWGATATLSSLFDFYFYVKPVHVIAYALASYTTCHFTVFKGDKYLLYFRQFDKWSKTAQWKYGLLTFAFIAGSYILWLYSFRFLP
ncbi:MAG: hypothetical protein ACK5JL_07985 [Candidatus Kapaibacterium sp.]|jgi:hypothetical protein